ncbi:MAG TPA: XRE family transcriptional regulator, partial [Nocardioidaceae bacterium]|nr:XRE family transcriptional regulator [Nocardioidaceae bacterium]
MATSIPPVGDRIREERTRRSLSVRQLARDVGVSASLISQIENGRSRPSVSTLYAITQALGISVEDVFDTATGAAATPASATPAAASATAAATLPSIAHALTATGRPDLALGPLVRPDQREVLELDSGVTWERLGRIAGAHVDFMLVTYAPGSSSSSTGQLMRHPGDEYGYLISGALVVTLAFVDHELGPGDAISFPSSTPHRYRNDGAT